MKRKIAETMPLPIDEWKACAIIIEGQHCIKHYILCLILHILIDIRPFQAIWRCLSIYLSIILHTAAYDFNSNQKTPAIGLYCMAKKCLSQHVRPPQNICSQVTYHHIIINSTFLMAHDANK